MPNVEIHGFRLGTGYGLRTQILELFQAKSWNKEYVVTIIPSEVTDCDGTEQPFIRLVNTPSPDNDAIIAELKKLELDIELLELKAFIPKQLMASEKPFIDDSMITI